MRVKDELGTEMEMATFHVCLVSPDSSALKVLPSASHLWSRGDQIGVKLLGIKKNRNVVCGEARLVR